MKNDAEKFGAIVDTLIGKVCERSLACNSIKLRFNTQEDPRGEQYIWIDPPWDFFCRDQLITSSEEYLYENDLDSWFNLFEPLDKSTLVKWYYRPGKDLVLFIFEDNYVIRLFQMNEDDSDSWYKHWYARDKVTEPNA